MEQLNLIRKKKEDIEKIKELILKEKYEEKKYDLYKQILKIDNTDSNILLEYLLLVNQNQKIKGINKGQEEIKSYINHFPPSEFNKHFKSIVVKEHSSIEKILIVFTKILSEDWIKTTFEKRREAYDFFLQTIRETFYIIKNTSPITWENKELYIFYLYKNLLLQLKRKIKYYEENKGINEKGIESIKLNECDKYIKDMEKELNNPKHSKEFYDKTQLHIKQAKINRKLYAIIEGNFFQKYLKKFNSFLEVLKETYIKELSTIKFDNKKERDIFEYFMLFISNYDFENFTATIRGVWEFSFLNSINDKNLKAIEHCKENHPLMEFIFENDNKLIIKSKNIHKIEINNYNDYNLEYLLSNIYDIETFDEVKALQYVNIKKIDNHLYIKKIFSKWVKFNVDIFKSKAIKSLYQTLFKKYNDLLLEENELTIILNNIMFYSFEIDFAGMTDRETMKIYEYSNYENLIYIYDSPLNNEDVLKVIFLAFNLVSNDHEILGHFNIGYQNEDIEIKLFGRVIDELTLKEALFILNLSNYTQNDYCQFRKKFMDCNKKDLIIDETLWNILVDTFNINPENILKAKNETYYLNHLIRKTPKNVKKFMMKRKHPMNYNIDGFTKEDFEFIENQIKLNNSLNESIYNNNNINNNDIKIMI